MQEAAFVARNVPWRVGLLILGALGFVVLGAWMAGLLGAAMRPGTEWVGWIAIVFFGACAVAWLPRLVDRREAIRIDCHGILIRAWSERAIAWSQIADVGVWQHQRQKMLVLRLSDRSLRSDKRINAWLGGVNKALSGGDVTASLNGTDRTLDETLAAIDRFRPQ